MTFTQTHTHTHPDTHLSVVFKCIPPSIPSGIFVVDVTVVPVFCIFYSVPVFFMLLRSFLSIVSQTFEYFSNNLYFINFEI